jgi:hypothetical protein
MLAEEFLSCAQMVGGSILPILLRLLPEEPQRAAKAIRKLVRVGAAQPMRFMADLIAKKPEDPKSYFKILTAMVNSGSKFDVPKLLQFCHRVLEDADLPPQVRSLALGTVCDLHFFNESVVESSFELCFEVSQHLIDQTVACEAVRFLSTFSDKIEFGPLFPRLFEIAAGRVPCDPPDQRVIAHYVSIICSQKGVPFPAPILYQYLGNPDVAYQTRALVILRLTLATAEDTSALLAQAALIAKTTSSSFFVNEFLLLACEYLRQRHTTCDEIDDVLFGILQGRIALLEHNLPFDYDAPQFKLYRLLCCYIELFPKNAAPIVCDLAYWTSAVSRRVLPKLAKPLNLGLKLSLLTPKTATDLWQLLLERLADEWHDSSVCTCGLGLAVGLRDRYPGACNLPDLLAFMQFMWESEDRDEELMDFLPAVFLDICVNEREKLPIPDAIFEEIFALIETEQFSWNYPTMTTTVAAICEASGFLYEFQIPAAMMFAHFITKSDAELRKQNFEPEQLAALGKALNWCVDALPDVARHLKLKYRGYPAKMDRLAAVIGIE